MDDVMPPAAADTQPAAVLPPEPAAPAGVVTASTAPPAPLDWGISPQDTPSAKDMSVQPEAATESSQIPGSEGGPSVPEMPPMGSVGPEETLVIPPAAPNTNPFIPQGVAPAEQNGVQTPPPRAGNPLLKRIVMILLFFVVVAGIGFGAKYILGMVSTSKQVTLTYWGLWEDSPTIQNAIMDFQAGNPKVKVTYVKQSPRQYRERLQAAITRGDGPDVFQFHNTWVPMLGAELQSISPGFMTPAEFSTTFYPVATADLVRGQAIYGAPLMFDGLGLYYNEDLLVAAGVKPPTTWPEVLDAVPKLTVRTDTQIRQSAIALGTTANVENFSDIVGLMMIQNGARLANPVGKEAEDTLTFYRKFANPSDPVYTWNETMDNSIYAFANGKVAMILAPSWRAFDVKQINPNLHFKIATVPQLPGNTVNWASYWVGGVSSKSKNKDQAWMFLKFLVDKTTMTKMYSEEAKIRLFGEPYSRVDLAGTITADPYVGAYVAGAPTAKSFPLASRTFDNGLNDKLIQYVTDAVNAVGQGTAPAGALQTAAAGFNQVLTSYGLSTGAAPATP